MIKETFIPTGHGPGAQTPDGCSIEFYKQIPYRGELEKLTPQLTGKKVLELGSGAGRLTRRLLELGCTVTAVDDSEEMLQMLPTKVHSIQSSIEALSTSPDFDVALLASYIFNKPERPNRQALIESVLRHLKQNGRLLLQVHKENLLTDVDENRVTTVDGISSRISQYTKNGSIVSMTVHYVIGSDEWTHSFQAKILGIDEIRYELLSAGFSKVDWADRENSWISATR